MKWAEFKKKFLELCDFNNMEINDVSVVKTYWERGYTVEETYEIWEDGVINYFVFNPKNKVLRLA